MIHAIFILSISSVVLDSDVHLVATNLCENVVQVRKLAPQWDRQLQKTVNLTIREAAYFS